MKIALIAALIFVAAFSRLAIAKPDLQPFCNFHDVLIGHLAERYREKTVGLGVLDDGRLVELLTTSDGATWTLIATNTAGWSCMLGAGKDWQDTAHVENEGPDA